jgi:hypothetical protein
MRCPKCRLENPEEALRCDCGYDFESGEVKRSYSDVRKVYNESTNYSGIGEFFSFKRMVSFGLIKLLYVLGIIGILVYGINQITENKWLMGISIILLGNLIWRLFCEIWILAFSIHNTLVSIDKGLKKSNVV